MKTITFEGKKYEVEDWVRFVARDQDGAIWGYEERPTSDCWEAWGTDGLHGGRTICLSNDENSWVNSLIEV